MHTTLAIFETVLREATAESARASAHGAGSGTDAGAPGGQDRRVKGAEASSSRVSANSARCSSTWLEDSGHLCAPFLDCSLPLLSKGECTQRARSPSTASDASEASTCLAERSGISREGSPPRASDSESASPSPTGVDGVHEGRRAAAPLCVGEGGHLGWAVQDAEFHVVDLTACDADSDRGAPGIVPDELHGETFSMCRAIMPRRLAQGTQATKGRGARLGL